MRRSKPPAALLAPLTTLAVLPLAIAAPTPAHAAPHAPTCAPAPGSRDFPVTARVHGGPDAYQAGGGYGTWSIDLTNTTARPCTGVHPVVVLVDERRRLRAGQPQLEFYAGDRPHPVTFEATDQDELVGAFDDGFPGFTLAPGRTLTVRVRLAITSDAVANEVTANAAVVHRRGDDGDWVGQSNDYRFTIRADPTVPAPDDPDPDPGTGTATPDPSATPRQDRLPTAEEAGEAEAAPGHLAATGRPPALPTAALATALTLTGTALRLLTRGRR
ncbi:hypothetical protein [Streptomyces flavalbus]|uniref:Gram-positive cocci surface proteins LPxTG domain-containing protein n=1 Tax=Streptomyces flavalbus TaxID=2665155 RepID=A0ABW2W9P4_9ACTN